MPALGAGVDCRVLAHRPDDDAVGQRDTAKVDSRKKLGGHRGPCLFDEISR
jgi:hypothetical protein